MATIHQQALRRLEDAGFPTGTIEPAHAGLPGLGGCEGQALVVRLLELDASQAEQLAIELDALSGGERR